MSRLAQSSSSETKGVCAEPGGPVVVLRPQSGVMPSRRNLPGEGTRTRWGAVKTHHLPEPMTGIFLNLEVSTLFLG